MKLRAVLPIMIGVLMLGEAGRVVAVPSAMTHEMSGVVQRADHNTITISLTGASKPVVFAWNSKDTQFLRDGRPTTSESLPIGAKVQIRCSHPIVGSAPLLYRVSWRTNAAGDKQKQIK